MTTTVELYAFDPKIVSEIEQFKIAVDEYVHQQTELARREQNDFIQFNKDDDEKTADLKRDEKIAKAKMAEIVTQQQKNECDIKKRVLTSEKLKKKIEPAVERVKNFSLENERLEEIIIAQKAKIEKEKRIYHAKVNQLNEELKIYEKNLGFRIEKTPKDLKIVYNLISNKDPDAEFWAVLKIVSDNDVKFLESSPALPGFQNSVKGKSLEFSKMIVLLRKEFKNLQEI